MRKWEYESYRLDGGGLLDGFNELGAAGWELVGLTKTLAYFMRPVESEFAAETLTATISSFDNFEEVIEKGIKFIERISKVAQAFVPTE